MNADPTREVTGGDHLSVEDIATYVDRAASGAERRRIERHLADCPSCGDEVLAAAQAGGPPAKRGSRWLMVAAVAAASIATLLWVPPLMEDDASDVRLRSADSRTTLVRVLRPADRALIAPTGAEFVWRPVAPDASYSFQIVDELGTILWTGATDDTLLSLAGRVLLTPGSTYYWSVDALLRDGRPASTGTHELRVRPQ